MRKMIQELDSLQQRNITIAAAREDIFRAKNAIDLVQKEIYQKRQVYIGLNQEFDDVVCSNNVLDAEIDVFEQKFATHQDELMELDE